MRDNARRSLTENRLDKRVCHISGLKSCRGRPKYLRSGQFTRVFFNSIWLRNKAIIFKEHWLLSSGRLPEVVAMRELNVSRQLMVLNLMIDLIGQLRGDVIGRLSV